MKDVLLISESFIKNVTNLSDNLSGKLLFPAIRESQEIGLREILGDDLLDKLKSLVEENTINDKANQKYKELLTQCQYYLAYQTTANVCILTAVKIDNAGLQQVSDEKMNPVNINDSFTIKDYYIKRADFYCLRLQNYLIENKKSFPELTNSDCNKIASNLHSSATCGLWLGGIRGKKIS